MRTVRKAGTGVAVLGSLVLVMSAAVPALASSGPSARLPLSAGVRSASLTNATNTGFGGWIFAPKTATSVTSEFKIPTLKCTSTTTAVGPLSAMVTGTSSAQKDSGAGVLLECSSGAPAAAATVIVNGTESNSTHALHVGDLMKATVTTSATTTKATIADLTAGHTFTFAKSGKGAAALEELIIDDALTNTSTGKQLPVANFGKISFSSGAVSGKPLGSVTPNQAVNMQTSKKVLQILTGALTGTKKNAFLTTWKHS
jgi:Peptidase A4 family